MFVVSAATAVMLAGALTGVGAGAPASIAAPEIPKPVPASNVAQAAQGDSLMFIKTRTSVREKATGAVDGNGKTNRLHFTATCGLHVLVTQTFSNSEGKWAHIRMSPKTDPQVKGTDDGWVKSDTLQKTPPSC